MTGWPPEEPEPFRYDVASGLAQGGPWEPPHPPSRLESKAIIAKVDPDAVRAWLRAEVERRTALNCGDVGPLRPPLNPTARLPESDGEARE